MLGWSLQGPPPMLPAKLAHMGGGWTILTWHL